MDLRILERRWGRTRWRGRRGEEAAGRDRRVEGCGVRRRGVRFYFRGKSKFQNFKIFGFLDFWILGDLGGWPGAIVTPYWISRF